MVLHVKSQNISIRENRVRTVVNEKRDTLVQMSYKDAKIILTNLLECQYTDSLLSAYIVKDSLNKESIIIQKDIINKLTNKTNNLQRIVDNLSQIIENKDSEIEIKNKIIKEQKKEIRKQKTYKIIGITGSIVLPILVLIYGG